jgi:hypothetical protein
MGLVVSQAALLPVSYTITWDTAIPGQSRRVATPEVGSLELRFMRECGRPREALQVTIKGRNGYFPTVSDQTVIAKVTVLILRAKIGSLLE